MRDLGNTKWKTKDGTILSWKQMDDRHLLNVARMVERSASDYDDAVFSVYATARGEMAIDACESALVQSAGRYAQATQYAQQIRQYVALRSSAAR